MLYIFLILIALSVGGIIFLGLKKFTFKNLVTKILNVFTRVKKWKNDELEDKNSLKISILKNEERQTNLPAPIQIGVQVGGGVSGEDYWINLISVNPINPKYYKRLGEWYMYNNKPDYAIKTLEYASKLDPKNKKILKHLENLKRQEV